MAKAKSYQQPSKGKSSSKSSSTKSQAVSAGSRTSSSNIYRTGGMNKGKVTSTRSAFLKGGRSPGGLGTWGLVGLLAALIVFAVLYFSGVFAPKSPGEVQIGLPAEISVAEAHELYPDGAFFLDVRTVEEYAEGYIPGSVNIPKDELANRLEEIPSDQEIVVVCRSGNRSQDGRDILLAAKFENVTSMAGGVSDWKDAGYPYDGDILR